ncbi:PDZ domain-containing protein [Candidatus Woesebacteria bacterium]|nr:PDZ domain-containing protein [Candidatus Woesebacteria bacterium]MCD8546416.1 PDZ domain-containing protein [Candidatus Woesebacteria bacterium]
MKRPNRLWFFALTHVLVIILGVVIGIRVASGLTFRQLIGLSTNISYSELARVQNTNVPAEHTDVDFSLFWEVWARLERDYLDPGKMDAQQMVYGAIAGMTEAIGDPYTAFLPPETKQRLNEDLQGEFNGVGIQLGYIDGQLAVIAPLKGHPAEAAGVKAGDYILGIKDPTKNVDTDTINMTAEEAVSLIRGKKKYHRHTHHAFSW